MPTRSFDVVILGGGNAGMGATVATREAGLNVAMIEPDLLGGTCPNRGCMPKKVLVAAAHALDEIERANVWEAPALSDHKIMPSPIRQPTRRARPAQVRTRLAAGGQPGGVTAGFGSGQQMTGVSSSPLQAESHGIRSPPDRCGSR